MNQEQEHDRTEPASQYKLDEARKRGEVSKSPDVNSMAMVVGMLLAFAIWADDAWHRLALLWIELLQGAAVDPATALPGVALVGLIIDALTIALAPIMAVAVILAILGNLLQTGPILSAVPVKPRFDRLNPINGFKRVFNKRMLFEAFKSVLKFALLGGLAAYFIVGLLPAAPALQSATPHWQLAWLGERSGGLVARLAAAMVVIALLDWIWSRFQYARQMRMSRREQKEEVKRREGDPLVRAKLRELQRANLKQARSMGRVQEADVVITNPGHLAVALRYVRGSMESPQVIAKGAEHWAAAIRRLAREHDVPVLQRRALARLLHERAVVGGHIPPESFVEVARLYAELAVLRRGAPVAATVVGGAAGDAVQGGR
jgi:flagellar biosynthetic protein FlhB